MKGKLGMSVLFCMILAVLFFAGDIAAIISAVDFVSNTETVQGIVTGYQKVPGYRRTSSYKYTVQYKASDGRLYETITSSGSHEKGDPVEVAYDRRNPQEAAASFIDVWIFVIICSVGVPVSLLIAYSRYKASQGS